MVLYKWMNEYISKWEDFHSLQLVGKVVFSRILALHGDISYSYDTSCSLEQDMCPPWFTSTSAPSLTEVTCWDLVTFSMSGREYGAYKYCIPLFFSDTMALKHMVFRYFKSSWALRWPTCKVKSSYCFSTGNDKDSTNSHTQWHLIHFWLCPTSRLSSLDCQGVSQGVWLSLLNKEQCSALDFVISYVVLAPTIPG